MTDSTRQVHWSGSALLAFSRVWVQVTGAVLFLAISIALEPSEFGEFAIAASVYSALALIVGHGVYEYVMKMHDSPTAPVTGFFLNMACAAATAALAIVISFFLTPLLKTAVVGHLLRLLAPTFFLQGCNTLMESVLMRRGQVGTVAILTMVADTLALGVALVFLGFGAGALSLVIQRLSREGILTAGFGLSRRWQMRFAFDFQEAKEIVRFAQNIIMARGIGAGAAAITDLFIGTALSVADAGLFRLANRLVNLGGDILFQPFRSTLWVRLPPLRYSPAPFARATLEMTEVFGVGLFAVLGGMAVTASAALPLVLGQKWQGAVPVVCVLAIGRLVSMPNCSAEAVLALRDRERFMVVSSIWGSILTLAAMVVSAPYGIFWCGVAAAVAGLLSQFYMLPVMADCCGLKILDFVKLMLRLTANALVMALVVVPWLVLGDRLGLQAWLLVVSAVLVGAIAYGLAARRFTPLGYLAYERPLVETFQQAKKHLIGRRPKLSS
jgi:O-antigen/teichoic acid export membrane protein